MEPFLGCVSRIVAAQGSAFPKATGPSVAAVRTDGRPVGPGETSGDPVKDVSPKNGRRGGRRRDRRTVLNGIVRALHAGAQWREVPDRYGPWKTVHGRSARRSGGGTPLKIPKALRLKPDERGRIDSDLWCADAAVVRGRRGRARTPRSCGPRGRPREPAGGKRRPASRRATPRGGAAAGTARRCISSATAPSGRRPPGSPPGRPADRNGSSRRPDRPGRRGPAASAGPAPGRRRRRRTGAAALRASAGTCVAPARRPSSRPARTGGETPAPTNPPAPTSRRPDKPTPRQADASSTQRRRTLRGPAGGNPPRRHPVRDAGRPASPA